MEGLIASVSDIGDIMMAPSNPHPYQHPISQQRISCNKNVPSSFLSSNDGGGHANHTIPRHEDSHATSSRWASLLDSENSGF